MIELQVKHSPEAVDLPKATANELLCDPEGDIEVVFEGEQAWQRTRPNTLVVACSDGRLQKSIDEFLEKRLGVVDYDRLYAPGGPGALGTGALDIKTDQLRRELRFLMEAHKVEEIVLLFHGADRSGPEDAVCAHYKRLLPGASRQRIARQHHADAVEAMNVINSIAPRIRVHVYRAEVRGGGSVSFVDLLRR